MSGVETAIPPKNNYYLYCNPCAVYLSIDESDIKHVVPSAQEAEIPGNSEFLQSDGTYWCARCSQCQTWYAKADNRECFAHRLFIIKK